MKLNHRISDILDDSLNIAIQQQPTPYYRGVSCNLHNAWQRVGQNMRQAVNNGKQIYEESSTKK